MRRIPLLPVLIILASHGPAIAEDWPQFRGPGGEGHSSEKGLPLTWSETANIQWKTRIPGRGWSSPAVLGNRIWLTTGAAPGGLAALSNVLLRGLSLRAIAVDRDTGRIVVDAEVFRLTDAGAMHAKNSHASPTPILEGDRVYVHFGKHGTAALNTAGEVLWKSTLPYNHLHGTGGSPILLGDLLILSCDGTDVQYVVALDKHTGKVKWKTERKTAMAYSTPLAITVNGTTQVVSPGAFKVVAYDPKSGKEIWWARYRDGFSNVPRPVYAHGLVFISTGFNTPSLIAVRVDGKGDVTDSHIAWKTSRGAPLTPSPLIVGDELYMVNDNGIASCLDAKTGEAHWRERLGGNFSASPLFADGRIYFLGEDGTTTVIQPGTQFKTLASNHIEGSALASLAPSNGAIFLRSDENLYCIRSR